MPATWADNETRSASISVSAPDAKTTKMIVNVNLRPYGSCEHVEVELGGISEELRHLGGQKVRLGLTARDSDNLPITKTELKFTVSWAYLGASSSTAEAREVARDVAVLPTTAGKYTATVPRDLMTRAGGPWHAFRHMSIQVYACPRRAS